MLNYINETSEENAIKLLFDLFDYYEAHYECEYSKNPNDAPYYNGYNEEYSSIYKKCKVIVLIIRGANYALSPVAQEIKDVFSSQYIDSQVDIMLSICESNPTEAIGKAKELIESCCKTILDERKITWDSKWDITQIVNTTLEQLKLTPGDIPNDKPLADNIKAILGNLRGIVGNIAILRNHYGSGHGKSASYKGLEKRHARLAVSCSIALVEFLWESHTRKR